MSKSGTKTVFHPGIQRAVYRTCRAVGSMGKSLLCCVGFRIETPDMNSTQSKELCQIMC